MGLALGAGGGATTVVGSVLSDDESAPSGDCVPTPPNPDVPDKFAVLPSRRGISSDAKDELLLVLPVAPCSTDASLRSESSEEVPPVPPSKPEPKPEPSPDNDDEPVEPSELVSRLSSWLCINKLMSAAVLAVELAVDEADAAPDGVPLEVEAAGAFVVALPVPLVGAFD